LNIQLRKNFGLNHRVETRAQGFALDIPAGYGSQFITRLRRTTKDEN